MSTIISSLRLKNLPDINYSVLASKWQYWQEAINSYNVMEGLVKLGLTNWLAPGYLFTQLNSVTLSIDYSLVNFLLMLKTKYIVINTPQKTLMVIK